MTYSGIQKSYKAIGDNKDDIDFLDKSRVYSLSVVLMKYADDKELNKFISDFMAS